MIVRVYVWIDTFLFIYLHEKQNKRKKTQKKVSNRRWPFQKWTFINVQKSKMNFWMSIIFWKKTCLLWHEGKNQKEKWKRTTQTSFRELGVLAERFLCNSTLGCKMSPKISRSMYVKNVATEPIRHRIFKNIVWHVNIQWMHSQRQRITFVAVVKHTNIGKAYTSIKWLALYGPMRP